MKQSLVNYLLANAGLSALVGTRIKWDVLPQGGSLPAIALHLISSPYDYTMRGRDSLTGYLVQMDVWSGTFAARESIASALRTALDAIVGGSFKAAFIEGQRDTFEVGDGPDAAGATNFYRASLDVRVWFNET